MSLDRFTRLDDLGIIWSALEAKWEDGFAELLRYQKEHGNCKVNSTHVTNNGYKLGSWVSVQRKRLHQTADQIQRLDDLGFVWKVK